MCGPASGNRGTVRRQGFVVPCQPDQRRHEEREKNPWGLSLKSVSGLLGLPISAKRPASSVLSTGEHHNVPTDSAEEPINDLPFSDVGTRQKKRQFGEPIALLANGERKGRPQEIVIRSRRPLSSTGRGRVG